MTPDELQAAVGHTLALGQELIGLSQAEAVARAREQGLRVRAEYEPDSFGRRNLAPDRLTLTVEDGQVVAVRAG
jgi:hypothetical protein